MGRSITEEGVAEIEVAASSVFNRTYIPVIGRVKWFEDELGQLWVKFDAHKPTRSAPDHFEHMVIPADRVVHVKYHPHPRSGT